MIVTFEGVRFHTVTSWPDCSKALTIRDPMLPSPRNPIFSGTVLEMTNSSAELTVCDDMMSGRYSAVFRLIYNKYNCVLKPRLWWEKRSWPRLLLHLPNLQWNYRCHLLTEFPDFSHIFTSGTTSVTVTPSSWTLKDRQQPHHQVHNLLMMVFNILLMTIIWPTRCGKKARAKWGPVTSQVECTLILDRRYSILTLWHCYSCCRL